VARIKRSSKLDTPSARANLPQRKSPYWQAITPGFAQGYRRAPKGGVWLTKLVIPGRLRQETTLGTADDTLDADGVYVLSFAQAQEKARRWKAQIENKIDGGDEKPVTIREAISSYEADLRARGGDLGNVMRLRSHLADHQLLDKSVASLTSDALRAWRDGLAKKLPRRKMRAKSAGAASVELPTPTELSPSSINRTCAALKAALNRAADDPRQQIRSRRAWQQGLESLPESSPERNVILTEDAVRQIVSAAKQHSLEFGLLVEVIAVTGARPSQVARLTVEDLQADRADPRLMMPPSRKGRKGAKKPRRYPVPITADLATRLTALATGKPSTAPLLIRPFIGKWRGGEPWDKDAYDDPFDELVEQCGLSNWQAAGYPSRITMYALRHTSVVHQLKVGVPIRIVAVNHDTSVDMIERNYSRYIGDHTDAITRAALLDTSLPCTDNVVLLRDTKA
jgi:integrase